MKKFVAPNAVRKPHIVIDAVRIVGDFLQLLKNVFTYWLKLNTIKMF